MLVSTLILTACGGGGGGGAETAASTNPTTPPASSSTAPVAPPSTTPAPPASTPTANSAPTIQGSAITTATVGTAYNFTPAAADPDQDKVTFTISNKPAWATFTATTGALTGTPSATDVGAFQGIEIAATDGKEVTALPAFTITVTPAADDKAVTVSWTPPTQNDDGSSLQDLKGYKIHYGSATRTYTQVVSIDNVGLTSYTLESLPAGTHYIAMTALNSIGEESDYSAEVTARLN